MDKTPLEINLDQKVKNFENLLSAKKKEFDIPAVGRSGWIDDYIEKIGELVLQQKNNIAMLSGISSNLDPTDPYENAKSPDRDFYKEDNYKSTSEWMLSRTWEKRNAESNMEFNCRYDRMMKEFKKGVKEKGLFILTQNYHDRLFTVTRSKDIDMDELRNVAELRGDTINHYKFGKQWICPYCKDNGRGWFMCILNPSYNNGFIDKGGVMTKCLCVKNRQKDWVQSHDIKHKESINIR